MKFFFKKSIILLQSPLPNLIFLDLLPLSHQKDPNILDVIHAIIKKSSWITIKKVLMGKKLRRLGGKSSKFETADEFD